MLYNYLGESSLNDWPKEKAMKVFCLLGIKNADEIIVLTEKGVQERGTHAELLAKNGIYAGLYRYQFRE